MIAVRICRTKATRGFSSTVPPSITLLPLAHVCTIAANTIAQAILKKAEELTRDEKPAVRT